MRLHCGGEYTLIAGLWHRTVQLSIGNIALAQYKAPLRKRHCEAHGKTHVRVQPQGDLVVEGKTRKTSVLSYTDGAGAGWLSTHACQCDTYMSATTAGWRCELSGERAKR